ncbi:hypothetical protein BN2497_14299 [Janthinobacterium sp. CG23_2]|nr:hypothetical protein BN2497_14299 [Janthinobacterium sp. CG23_2]CUU33547.1 hypothetical protein BN3177_14299 [Janthinobacterium sp. CG23_2]
MTATFDIWTMTISANHVANRCRLTVQLHAGRRGTGMSLCHRFNA